MSKLDTYFPLGIAGEQAFLAREEQAGWLRDNIQNGVHSLLMAPRRFGKSSLALYTLARCDRQYIELDLQLCRSATAVEKKLIKSIEVLINKTTTKSERLISLAKKFFVQANKQWTIGLKGIVEFTLEPANYEDASDNILTALNFLESVLVEEDQYAIIFIDEVQEIEKLDESFEVQGALRHFAQKTKRVAFIFSGSNRRLLKHMFTDSSMPLYQLCDTLHLGRIDAADYHAYLQKISQKTWGSKMDEAAIDHVLALTERHPRRTYHLCLYLWRETQEKKLPPKVKDIDSAWAKLTDSESRGIRFQLDNYNTTQLKLLSYISGGNNKELTGKGAQIATGVSSSALSKAINELDQNDLIEEREGGYFILDPVVRAVFEKESLWS